MLTITKMITNRIAKMLLFVINVILGPEINNFLLSIAIIFITTTIFIMRCSFSL